MKKLTFLRCVTGSCLHDSGANNYTACLEQGYNCVRQISFVLLVQNSYLLKGCCCFFLLKTFEDIYLNCQSSILASNEQFCTEQGLWILSSISSIEKALWKGFLMTSINRRNKKAKPVKVPILNIVLWQTYGLLHLKMSMFVYIHLDFYQVSVCTSKKYSYKCWNATSDFERCGVEGQSAMSVSAGGWECPRASSYRHYPDGYRRVSCLSRHQPLHLLLLQRSAKWPQHYPQKPLPQPLHRRAGLPCGHQHDRTKGTVNLYWKRF